MTSAKLLFYFCFSLSWLPAYVSMSYVSILSVCVYTRYILVLWQKSLLLSSNWQAPLAPCLQDNWTCSPNACIPIIGSLQPLPSLWTCLWPLDQKEYTIAHCPNTSRLSLFSPPNAKYTRWILLHTILHPTSLSSAWFPWDKVQELLLRHIENKVIHFGQALLELFIRGSISKYSTMSCPLIIHA